MQKWWVGKRISDGGRKVGMLMGTFGAGGECHASRGDFGIRLKLVIEDREEYI